MVRKTNIIEIETKVERINRIMKVKSLRRREEIMNKEIMIIILEKWLRKLKNKHNNKILYYF